VAESRSPSGKDCAVEHIVSACRWSPGGCSPILRVKIRYCSVMEAGVEIDARMVLKAGWNSDVSPRDLEMRSIRCWRADGE